MKPKVLFVDDEPRVLSALKRSLRAYHDAWDITFAEGSKAGLAAFQNAPTDVVVSDLAMPGMDGLSMVLEMRRHRPETAFIMLTGTADLAKAVEAINKAEVFRFFTKPCATEMLVDGIVAGLAHVGALKAVGSKPLDAAAISGLSGAIGTAALNRLAVGVLVADANGRVLLANQAGGQVLAAQDGLSLGPNENCRASTQADNAKLQAAIKDAIAAHVDGETDTFGVSISRPSLKRAFNVMVMPLDVRLAPETGLPQRLAAVFVADPEEHPLPTAQTIQKLFALSPAEARLARALAEGQNLEDAAETCGVTASTARTYLKQIFGKTATGRQSELVKLVLTTPSVI